MRLPSPFVLPAVAPWRSWVRTGAVAATVSAAVVVLPGMAAQASGSSFAGATNELRATHGLPGYRICPDLNAIAAAWAQHMAATQVLAHDPALPSEMQNWTSLGENVGVGPTDGVLQAALVASPPHYANLTSRLFLEAGYATATDSHGEIWVDEVFRTPAGGSCGTAAPPVVTPTAAPSAAASPAPDAGTVEPGITAVEAADRDQEASRSLQRRVLVRVQLGEAVGERLARDAARPVPHRDVIASAFAFQTTLRDALR